MKIPSNWWRRLGLGSLGVLLIAALGYVVMHSGPLAPTRVTVTQAQVGSLSPSLFGIGTVEARRAYLAALARVFPRLDAPYAPPADAQRGNAFYLVLLL